jgi:hypothetical protein
MAGGPAAEPDPRAVSKRIPTETPATIDYKKTSVKEMAWCTAQGDRNA